MDNTTIASLQAAFLKARPDYYGEVERKKREQEDEIQTEINIILTKLADAASEGRNEVRVPKNRSTGEYIEKRIKELGFNVGVGMSPFAEDVFISFIISFPIENGDTNDDIYTRYTPLNINS